MRPGHLDGWKFTDHALKRALKRRLDPDEIREALNAPRCVIATAKGTEERAATTCTVVVNPIDRVIITVY